MPQAKHHAQVIGLMIMMFLVQLGLVACGGGESNSTAPLVLQSAERLQAHTQTQISQAVSRVGIGIPDSQFKYDVTLYRLVYKTTNGSGVSMLASGVLALPNKPAGIASPLLSFQHGTLFQNKEAPSNDLTPGAPPVVLASLGYITVAADYLGYGISHGTPHPYLLAKPSATAVVDLLKASQEWLSQQHIPLNQQLFLTGYSEGGYVTMAAHQSLERTPLTGLKVIASIPAAGPYHLTATLDYYVSSTRIQNAASRLSTQQEMVNARLPNAIADPLTDFIMSLLIPADSDINFEDTVIREYLRNGADAIAENNLHDWQTNASVRLFHGRHDVTVPFFNATDAATAMQARGSIDTDLVECTASPADHETCIPEYGAFLSNTLQNMAQGL